MIIDSAEKMIRQSGYIPYEEIIIEFRGLRPGEKMYEELLLDPQTTIKTQSEKIFIDRVDLIEFNESRFKELVFYAETNHKDTKDLLFKQLNLKG